MKNTIMLSLNLLLLTFVSCAGSPGAAELPVDEGVKIETMNNTETITLGAGCFWCVEAIFQELEGVEKATSGYMGGRNKNPTYKEVCSGLTGHAEVVQVVFDPEKISVDEILEVFWKTHDPTTKDRQGADVGSQYRSAVFYHNNNQKAVAEAYKNKLDAAGIWPNPIVTEIVPATTFYKAEGYHQDYYSENTEQGYCRMVITPKLEKFRKVFADKLKKEGVK